jgi:hypothetical protein
MTRNALRLALPVYCHAALSKIGYSQSAFLLQLRGREITEAVVVPLCLLEVVLMVSILRKTEGYLLVTALM